MSIKSDMTKEDTLQLTMLTAVIIVCKSGSPFNEILTILNSFFSKEKQIPLLIGSMANEHSIQSFLDTFNDYV